LEITTLLLLAPGVAREETRYRELAQRTADACPDRDTRAVLWTHIAGHLPPFQRGTALRKIREALGGEELPSTTERFGEKAFGRNEPYV
jgi:hypothetical protein